LGGISATSLNAKTFEQLFPTVSLIDFSNIEGLENIVLSSDQMTSHGHGSQKDLLQRLEHVKVNGWGDIRTLFPAKSKERGYWSLQFIGRGIWIGWGEELPLLSSLTELRLLNLPELKCIWKGPTRHVSLQSLNHLGLWYLDKLTFIFTPSLAQSLIHLETLQIEHCGGLKRLIRVSWISRIKKSLYKRRRVGPGIFPAMDY
jgi:disease resistance protein RPS2